MNIAAVLILRLLRWRAAWAIVAGLYFVGWFVVAGFNRAVIQVDFAAFPSMEGAEVLIDGEPAGTLFHRGRRYLTGFKVKIGEHTVEVPTEGYVTEPTTVNAELRGVQYLLYAYPDSRRRSDGSYEKVLMLGRSLPD